MPRRIASVPAGRLVSFALTPRAGHSYAVNGPTGGTIYRLPPRTLRRLGYVL